MLIDLFGDIKKNKNKNQYIFIWIEWILLEFGHFLFIYKLTVTFPVISFWHA